MTRFHAASHAKHENIQAKTLTQSALPRPSQTTNMVSMFAAGLLFGHLTGTLTFG